MIGFTRTNKPKTAPKVLALFLAAVLAATFCFPSVALAQVSVDGTELEQGSNSVGGGTATLSETSLSMSNVTAGSVYTDESLDIAFTGGNDIETFTVEGDAEASMHFTEKNEVEDIYAADNAKLTVKADGHNDFEEVNASSKSDVTIEVYGENSFESIEASDDSNVTVKGKTCQMRDKVVIGEGEGDEGITAENGNVRIDHVTVLLESEKAHIESKTGAVIIDTSKIASEDDNEWTEIISGKEMLVSESIIEIEGTVYAQGKLTINHSDVKVEKAGDEYDSRPYRVF